MSKTNIVKLYKKINNNKDIIIFGISSCIYTKNSLKLLQENNYNYKYYSIDKYYNLFFNLLNELAIQIPELLINIEHKTVPVIFYNKKFVGGYLELKKYLNK